MSRKKKQYSRVDEIKLYHQFADPVDATLVLEGGAFRGLYTAGVLDCFIDNGIYIKNAVGISAGALNGINYLARCRGRTAICVLKHRFDPRYVGIRAYHESGSVVGFRFMFEDLNEELYLDENEVIGDKVNLYVGATCLETGETEYFLAKGKQLLLDSVKASASMPIVSKPTLINGKHYLDGGCKIKLPIKYALDNNFKKIIFIGTRPLSYRRKIKSTELEIEKKMYHKYPKFIQSLSKANEQYNVDAEFLENLASKKAILAIAPSERVSVKRLEKDIEKLGDLYMLGYQDALNRIDEIREYLKGEN